MRDEGEIQKVADTADSSNSDRFGATALNG